MTWIFHQPLFAADQAPELPPFLVEFGAWSGHRRFAYDLVSFTKPKTIVELGTFYGISYFSFCQAVRDKGLPSRCYAIDTWRGDPHVGVYNDNVYQAVHAVNSREFPSFSQLIRSDFDSAVSSFQDETIDLLHIDGYHTYEAVKHDYLTWYPKVAQNGIVLFHDIAVRQGDFGVYKLWEELAVHSQISFTHSSGLGVLFPKGVPEKLKPLLDNKDSIIHHYTHNH